MPGFVGADVDQLRALSRRFADAAERLRGVMTEVSNRVDSVHWVGADVDRFRARWRGESLAQLRSAAEALRAAATTLQRNAEEQEQASSAGAGIAAGGFGLGPPRHAWGWPGDGGATPWFLNPGGGIPDPGMTPTLPSLNNAAGPQWSFPNPFDEYRDFVGQTPIWPISIGTAIGMTPLGGAMHYADAAALAFDDRLGAGERVADGAGFAADLVGGRLRQAGFDSRNPVLYLSGVATSQWGDVVSEFAKADFSPATVANNIDFVAAHPGEAFDAARDAVVNYIPKLISNFSFNPFGK
ncbi:conserved hypothetical protein [Mycolicibacter sinensis]|uniref:WXG100 family type VII secretion target n=1 Tax=Mycolicibacter sinensis (strain JDM601) TaxID=875328 RepID=F5Z061_MYCSD|nr:hypothetical protein [Mycolicibacter sinensis]AEF36838.1 conserved hypothetical protein [Mycolicibacter sinensis]